MSKSTLVAPGALRPLIEPQMPDWVEAKWFMTPEEALELAPEADIGWLDMTDKPAMALAIGAATKMQWLNSMYTGIDFLPTELLIQRNTIVTNGVGINAVTIAEYVVMGMLSIAKGYREIIRAQDQKIWLPEPPGKVELYDSRALILGYCAIGQAVENRLKAFGVDVTVVRRTPGENALGPDEWRDKLGAFDWVILSVPATAETDGMIGADELAAMKETAVLINIARGTVVDQDALITALQNRSIGAAFLDVTDPEPLPVDSPLWTLDNAHITMHLSGRAQTKMFHRSAERFLSNLARYHAGEPLSHIVDLARGY